MSTPILRCAIFAFLLEAGRAYGAAWWLGPDRFARRRIRQRPARGLPMQRGTDGRGPLRYDGSHE